MEDSLSVWCSFSPRVHAARRREDPSVHSSIRVPRRAEDLVMEDRISHLSVTSSNAKGHEEPLPSGGFEDFQALSAVVNGTRVITSCTAFTEGLGNSRSLRSPLAPERMRLRDRISGPFPPAL